MSIEITDPADPLFTGPNPLDMTPSVAPARSGFVAFPDRADAEKVYVWRAGEWQSAPRRVAIADGYRVDDTAPMDWVDTLPRVNHPRSSRVTVEPRKPKPPEPQGEALVDPLAMRAITPDGRVLKLDAAEAEGFEPVPACSVTAEAARAYAASVRAGRTLPEAVSRGLFAIELAALPEAEGRQRAACDIAVAYHGRWDVERARRFLAGLPRAGDEPIEVIPAKTLRQKLDALAFALRAPGASAAEHARGREIAYALSIPETSAIDIREACRMAGVDLRKLNL